MEKDKLYRVERRGLETVTVKGLDAFMDEMLKPADQVAQDQKRDRDAWNDRYHAAQD